MGEDESFERHAVDASVARSEEHTSELQSPCNLVCRLLLEKKKTPAHSIFDLPRVLPSCVVNASTRNSRLSPVPWHIHGASGSTAAPVTHGSTVLVPAFANF